MRQLQVVFHVGVSAIVPALKRKRGVVGISETKLLGVGAPFQKIGILIEPEIVCQIIEHILLTDLLEGLLIFRSLGGLINLGFPQQIALVGFRHRLHILTTLYIHSVLGLDPEDFGWRFPNGMSLEGFIDCLTSQFEVLLELIAGDKLR